MEVDRMKGKSTGQDSKEEGKWKDGKTKFKGKGKDYGYGKVGALDSCSRGNSERTWAASITFDGGEALHLFQHGRSE